MASAASAASVVAEPSAPAVQCLSFLFHNEAYALPLLRVREIVRFEGATRVPRVAPWVRGVVNLRGSVVPVLDNWVWLARADATVSSHTCLLIVFYMFKKRMDIEESLLIQEFGEEYREYMKRSARLMPGVY